MTNRCGGNQQPSCQPYNYSRKIDFLKLMILQEELLLYRHFLSGPELGNLQLMNEMLKVLKMSELAETMAKASLVSWVTFKRPFDLTLGF